MKETNQNPSAKTQPAAKKPETKISERTSMTGSAHEFRKVMRGYDPVEVDAYITELGDSIRKTSRTYEARMADMKQELTLANRESENLRAKLKEYQDNPEIQRLQGIVVSQPVADTNEELIAQLKNRIVGLQFQLQDAETRHAEEVEALRRQNTEILAGIGDARAKEEELDKLARENALLKEEAEKNKPALENAQLAAAQIESLTEQKDVLSSELQVSADRIAKLEDDAVRSRNEISRITVDNSLLEEKNAKYREEIVALKAEGKTKAYEFAERFAAREDELNSEILTMKKKLQLQSYHISQADTAVAELANQIMQIKSAFSEDI